MTKSNGIIGEKAHSASCVYSRVRQRTVWKTSTHTHAPRSGAVKCSTATRRLMNGGRSLNRALSHTAINAMGATRPLSFQLYKKPIAPSTKLLIINLFK